MTATLGILPIIFDTGEKQPWLLIKPTYPDVEMVRKHLRCGDYSTVGAEELLTIEKKRDLDELAQCCSNDRPRFERQWKRACEIGYRRKYLITQGCRYIDVCEGNYRIDLAPRSFEQTLTSWEDKYGIHMRFVDSDTEAQKLVYSFCLHAFKASYGTGIAAWERENRKLRMAQGG